MCISKIISSVTIESGQSLPDVYIYTKNYYQPAVVDSTSYRYHVSVPKMILIKKERLSKTGEIIYREELLDYSVQ